MVLGMDLLLVKRKVAPGGVEAPYTIVGDLTLFCTGRLNEA